MVKSTVQKVNKFVLQRNEDGSKLIRAKLKGEWKTAQISQLKKYLDRCGVTFLAPAEEKTIEE